MRDGKPVLVRLPEINFIDDKADKPVGINQHIGRHPSGNAFYIANMPDEKIYTEAIQTMITCLL